MYFSTLGYKSNPLLDSHRGLFLEKIQAIWRSHISNEIPIDDFLFSPDIHSLLLSANFQENTKDKELTNFLIREYSLYRGQSGTVFQKSNERIPGTHISLTSDFYKINAKYAHPEHEKNNIGITFWSKSFDDWKELFSHSFSLLATISPGFMSEIHLVIKKIIPFDVSSKKHNSGSYSNAIGCLLMSYPVEVDNPEFVLIEAIIHEYNHNKLHLINQNEKLVLSDKREIYYSPYRPDARHLQGIYFWVHALSATCWVMLNTQKSNQIQLPTPFLEKTILYVLKNWLSFQVLDKYGHFSSLWKELLEEMRWVHRECLSFVKELDISPDRMNFIKWDLMKHYYDVKTMYPWILD